MSCHRIIMKGGHKVCLPVTSREEYLKLRDSKANTENRIMAGMGNEDAKRNLVQMNYSCLPNDDGTLKGSTRMSTTVGMDVDHIPTTSLEQIKKLILSKKDVTAGFLSILSTDELKSSALPRRPISAPAVWRFSTTSSIPRRCAAHRKARRSTGILSSASRATPLTSWN